MSLDTLQWGEEVFLEGMWVLRTKPGSCAGAPRTLTCRAIPPPPKGDKWRPLLYQTQCIPCEIAIE